MILLCDVVVVPHPFAFQHPDLIPPLVVPNSTNNTVDCYIIISMAIGGVYTWSMTFSTHSLWNKLEYMILGMWVPPYFPGNWLCSWNQVL